MPGLRAIMTSGSKYPYHVEPVEVNTYHASHSQDRTDVT